MRLLFLFTGRSSNAVFLRFIVACALNRHSPSAGLTWDPVSELPQDLRKRYVEIQKTLGTGNKYKFDLKYGWSNECKLYLFLLKLAYFAPNLLDTIASTCARHDGAGESLLKAFNSDFSPPLFLVPSTPVS